MNTKLMHFSNHLELYGVLLLLFSALRADGGLHFWLPIALTGIVLCLAGLGLSWLCSESGRAFRRRNSGIQAPPPATSVEKLIPFPKAG